MKKILLILSILALFVAPAKSNLEVSTNLSNDPEEFIRNFLEGNGVVIQNIRITGNTSAQNSQFGIFDGRASNIGLESGIIISTGKALDAPGPNNSRDKTFEYSRSGDQDLQDIVGRNTLDAAVIEFEFIPSFDEVTFEYVFASEEYNEFVCTQFNDVFAFLVSGPGISGKQNVALLPTGDAVAINSVHKGCTVLEFLSGRCRNVCDPKNREFFIDNDDENTVEYDGFTTVLQVRMEDLQPGEIYNMKFAIADVSDGYYDSAVFLAANSFSSESDILVDGDYCFGSELNFDFDSPWQYEEVSWDFGNGDLSDELTPTYTYDFPGLYRLKFNGKRTNQDNYDSAYIDIAILGVIPDFDITGKYYSNFLLEFADNSQDPLGDQEYEVYWDYGNGILDTGKTVNYAYPQTGDYTVTMIVITEDGCVSELTRDIEIKRPAVDIAVTDTCVNTGDVFIIEFEILNPDVLTDFNLTSIDLNIRLNGNVFMSAAPSPLCKFEGNTCKIALPMNRLAPDVPFKPVQLKLIGLLGDTDVVQVEIDSIEAGDDFIDVNVIGGELCILDICREGGDRFVEDGSGFDILGIYPNPSSGLVKINYETPAQRDVSISVVNLLGQTVAVLAEGDFLSGQYLLEADLSNYPTGKYLLVMQSPFRKITRILEVVK
jgi:hypothetical protein